LNDDWQGKIPKYLEKSLPLWYSVHNNLQMGYAGIEAGPPRTSILDKQDVKI
jgi:hypothetical protein